MKTKTNAEVIIGGKRYNISGYESEEYLQKIASYINGKYSDMEAQGLFRLMDMDMRTILMHINIADDYFKLKEQVGDIAAERDTQNGELFNVKQDLIELQKEHEALKVKYKQRKTDFETEIDELKEKLNNEEKKSIKFETENKGLKSTLAESEKVAKKGDVESVNLKKEIEKLKADAEKLKADTEKYKAEYVKLKTEYGKLKDENAKFEEENAKLKKNAEAGNKSLEALNKDNAALKSENAALRSDKVALTNEVANLRKRIR